MKKTEWNEGLNNLDIDLVEEYVDRKDKLRQNEKKKKQWLRFGSLAACFALIAGVLFVLPLLREGDSGIIPNSDRISVIPIVNIKSPSLTPHYYGSDTSVGASMPGQASTNSTGISVTAKLDEVLLDTYTFFDDWSQYEFRLLKMKTVKLLKGKEITDEFYYLIPVAFMTDYSLFDSFVIKDMAQFTYDYSVMYNKTQGKAEQFDLVIFGYRTFGYYLMGESFMAFDSDGRFDGRLWEANEAWISSTDHSQKADTITQAEEGVQQGSYGGDVYVHLLKDISGEAERALSEIKSFENGLYVPTFSSTKHQLSPEVQFHAVRYINGFATNERISVFSKEVYGESEDVFKYTQARFEKDDLDSLPDLTSAYAAVVEALKKGDVSPPHFNNELKIKTTSSGVFGWYAKTENGVIGVVRITWSFYAENMKHYYDDAYYIAEYGTDQCTPIERDDLLEMLGNYEVTYIHMGGYDKYGKISDVVLPQT